MQIHDKVTTSLLAITAGVLNYVSKVLSQQSAAETRIYGLLEKQFVNDPTAMCGSVAEWLRRWTRNSEVASSIPGRGAVE